MRSEGEEEGELAGAGQQLKKCSVQAVKNIWRKKNIEKWIAFRLLRLDITQTEA